MFHSKGSYQRGGDSTLAMTASKNGLIWVMDLCLGFARFF